MVNRQRETSLTVSQWPLLVVFSVLLPLLVGVANSGERPVYGTDDRQEWDKADARICAVGRATAAIMPKASFAPQDGRWAWRLIEDHTLADSNWCDDERFAQQPDLATCTAFLIGPSRVVTAAHCINAKGDSNILAFDCEEVLFVFDYEIMDDGEVRRQYQSNQIYTCHSIVHHNGQDGPADWAVIELDRATGRSPVALYTGNLKSVSSEPLEIIGHPLGLPLKWVRNGRMVSASSDTFLAAIDAFEGNSGSPVFIRKDGVPTVVGMLSRGVRDYKTPVKTCLRTQVCNGKECAGESVTRASQFAYLSTDVPGSMLASVDVLDLSVSGRAACL
ncbi:hypothetical protein AB833_31600 [Chromatiales bacterium (ex Bugula neritina AB1)]|nr:hypothetical protein AB833_31600 [Chromatiales bacterium (ex Bugula neritina AB1)]